MILKGKYTNASVFAETIDSETLTQIREMINQNFMKNSKVAIMPDAHAGAGICIGFTASLNGKVVPNFVGVDIGCGVASQRKEILTVEEYKRQMAEAGVWSTCIGQGTLDESPMAYKDSTEIKRVIGDTVDIEDHWKEVYNFKAKE
jgi:RNA-splicing ligase RtcB